MKGFKNDTNNFQPRARLRPDPLNDKTVVRGAGGLSTAAAHYGEMAQGFANSVDGYARYDFPSVEATDDLGRIARSEQPALQRRPHASGAVVSARRSIAQGRPFSLFFHPANLQMPRSVQANVGVERQFAAVAVGIGNTPVEQR